MQLFWLGMLIAFSRGRQMHRSSTYGIVSNCGGNEQTIYGWDSKVYSPYRLANLVDVLSKKSIYPEMSLEGTGISFEILSKPETLTSLQQYFTAASNAVNLSSDPKLPFQIGSQSQLSAYGIYGFLLACSPTMRESFNCAAKYQRLADFLLSTAWCEIGEWVSWTFSFDPLCDYPKSLRRFLLEHEITECITRTKEITGDCRFSPILVRLPYVAPSYAHLYSSYFGCEVQFDQPVAQLLYPGAIVNCRTRMAHRPTYELLQETCDRILEKMKTSICIAKSVYQIIATTPGHSPNMETVARELATTARTLHRRLRAEGTSFAEIMDHVRYAFAKEYLDRPELSTEEISERLGFSDAANFRHAFRRWTGSTPGRYRGLSAGNLPA
jgi:AraC-like DNA-binding protein